MHSNLEHQLSSLNRSPASEPDPAWIERLKVKLSWMTENPVATHVPPLDLQPRYFPRWHFLLFTGSAFAVFLLLGVSITLAAQRATPDAMLYPVKLASEDLRRVLATPGEAKARLELELADRRMEEFKTLTRKQKLSPQTAASLETRYQVHVTAALSALPAVSAPQIQALAESIAEVTDEHAKLDTELEFELSQNVRDVHEEIQQMRQEMQARTQRMREFAKDSARAARELKARTGKAEKVRLKIETDAMGTTHVKLEVEERNHGHEQKRVDEFTVPADVATSTTSIIQFQNEEDDQDENGNEEKGRRQSEPKGYLKLKFEKKDKGKEELKGRSFNNGVFFKVESEASSTGSSVEQRIDTNIKSESKIELRYGQE